MIYLRQFINHIRDILFVILFFHHAGLRFERRKTAVISTGVLFLLFTMGPTDYLGAFPSAIYRTLFRGIIIFLYLLPSQQMSMTIAAYYSFFIDAVILICHNIFFTPLTRPLMLFSVTLLKDPTLNAALCILLSNLGIILLFIFVCVLLPVDFSTTLSFPQVFSLALLTGIGTYLNGQMKVISMTTKTQLHEYSIFAIMLQISLLFCLILMESLNFNLKRRTAIRLQLMESQLLLKNIERKNDTEQKIRAIQHDIKNHFSSIRYLINEGNQNEALSYIDSLIGAKEIRQSNIQTGNVLLDGLLAEKRDDAEALHINLDISADFSALNALPSADLCILFGNILDNALEACQKVSESQRFIRIRSTCAGEQIIITVENSYNGKMIIGQSLPPTTKSDSQYHGIGLLQVKNILKKWDGCLVLKAEPKQHRFLALFRIPLESIHAYRPEKDTR